MGVMLKPLCIDDYPTSATVLESWMIFPRDGGENEFLRWSHQRNATLDELENQLHFTAIQASLARTKAEVAHGVPAPRHIELSEKQYVDEGYVLIRAVDLARLFQRPTALCLKLAKKNSVDGLVAGSLMLYMRLLEQHSISPPSSFDKAKVISEARDFPNRKKSKYFKSSIEPREKHGNHALEEVWHEFAPVSHLWAALHAIRGFKFTPIARPLAGISIPDLLAVASKYAEWGTGFFSNRMNRQLRKRHEFKFMTVTYTGKLPASSFDFCNLAHDDLAMKFVRKVYPLDTP